MTDFNFFSSYIGMKKASKIRYVNILLILAATVLFFSGFYMFTGYKLDSMNEELSKMNEFQKSGDTQKLLDEANTRKKQLDIISRYYAAVEAVGNSISAADAINSGFIKDVASALPGDVFIQSISASEGNVQMQGLARSRTSIAEFQHNLGKIETVTSTYVSVITSDTVDETSFKFAIKCTVKDVNGNEAD